MITNMPIEELFVRLLNMPTHNALHARQTFHLAIPLLVRRCLRQNVSAFHLKFHYNMPAPSGDLATNPGLLDFLRDELAITRVHPGELRSAYTLFDAVLQTRLVIKGPGWTTADCLAAARSHFAHLGTAVGLRVVRDEVQGLPTPQIVATAEAPAREVFTLPVDARPAGRGICVLDVAWDATPFSTAYHAGSHCQMDGLHQQVARRDCLVRAAGHVLQPFEVIAQHGDSISVWFMEDHPHATLRPRPTPPLEVVERLQEARDIMRSFLDQGGDIPIQVHWPGGAPVEFYMQQHWTEEVLTHAASQALQPFACHGELRLHLPSGMPRGTDSMLHFLAEMGSSLQSDQTMYLIDGRPLDPAGPPFRVACVGRTIRIC